MKLLVNFLLASALCVVVAVESLTIKYVQNQQRHDIPSEQLVLLVEWVKLSVSLILYLVRGRARHDPAESSEFTSEEQEGSSDSHTTLLSRGLDTQESLDPQIPSSDPLERRGHSSTLWYLLPAALYAVSNNVTFAALRFLSPGLFNLLMNLKIPFTGLMACALLGYQLTWRLGMSFGLLLMGSAFATLRRTETGLELEGNLRGMLLMVAYALCSATGSVFMEYICKIRYGGESIYLQNVKFGMASMAANVVIMMIRGTVPFRQLEPLHGLSVAALAMNGLTTAAVIKYAGSIVKTFAVSCSSILSGALGWLTLHTALRWNFYVGAVICTAAVRVYLASL